MAEWADDELLSFINEVENNPIIWNSRHPYFKLADKKIEAWEPITKKFNRSYEELNRKWLSLKASYRREKNKVMVLSTMKHRKAESLWFGYDAMHFMDYIYKDKTKTLDQLPKRLRFQIERESSSDEERHLKKRLETNRLSSNLTQTQKTTNGSRQNGQMEKSNKARNECERDEFSIFGDLVSSKLSKIDSHSNVVAQHFINKVIFEAELGRYKHSFDSEDD